MSDSWDDYADGWDTDPDVIHYSQLAFKSLTEQIELKGLTVLDFGCGTGLLTEKLVQSGAQVVAIDNSPKMIEILKSKRLDHTETHCDLVSNDFLQHHPDWQDRFDLVVASSVLSFVPNYVECLSLLTECLKPTGKLIHWDWYKHDNFGFDEADIEHGFSHARLKLLEINPSEFIMESKKGSMKVLKALGQKSS